MACNIDIGAIRSYACRCWARGAVLGEGSDPSEVCGGRVNFAVTETAAGSTDAFDVRVKFIHD